MITLEGKEGGDQAGKSWMQEHRRLESVFRDLDCVEVRDSVVFGG